VSPRVGKRRDSGGGQEILGKIYTAAGDGRVRKLWKDRGKCEAAEEINRRVLDGRERIPGPEHPDTLMSVGNLAGVLQDRSMHETAEEMNRRVLDITEKFLGREHPNTLLSINDLATVLRKCGKYEAAEKMN
jgi:Tetratricopeptide repeat